MWGKTAEIDGKERIEKVEKGLLSICKSAFLIPSKFLVTINILQPIKLLY